LRILIYSRLYGAGGAETHLLYLCRLLVERGAEVTLVSRVANPDTPLVRQHRQIPIRFLGTPFHDNLRWFRLSTLWAFLVWPFYLFAKPFDVLYTLSVSPFTKFLKKFVKPGGRVVLNRIGDLIDPSHPVYRDSAKIVDCIVVESRMHAEAMRQVYGNGVPIEAIPHLGHIVNPPPRKPGLRGDKFRITYIGRYHRPKGIFRLLDIWPELKIGAAELHYYGHGPERQALANEIQRRGLQSTVFLHGSYTEASELAQIFDRTDLLVLPSETEGLPVILLEAMAHGVPFVATDVGAVRTLAEDNPDVRVVPLDNGALKEAIEEMARGIRTGQVRGDRLQAYHRARYGYEVLSERWTRALLYPELLWGNSERRGNR
jgi:glycosyltransferase involved in cell wall biosynthesis